MIIIPKTSYVGRNIKSCLPGRSKTPDLGKIVFLNHPFLVKKGKKSCRKLMKLSLNDLYFNINVMRKCIGRRLDNIGPFSATETSVLREILQGLLSDFFFRSRHTMNQQIFEYKFINHFTAEHVCYFYFKVH